MRSHANVLLFRIASTMAAVVLAGVAVAEPDAGSPVPLQQLLKLPSGAAAGASIEKRGGSTRSEWEARFRKARADHQKAETQLAATRAALEKKAAANDSQWRVSAPGLGAAKPAEGGDSPLDYRLTQDLRRNREEVLRSERRIQDLGVEANLAGVPDDWRGEPPPLE